MARVVKWPAPIEARRGEVASDGVVFYVSGLTCADCAAQFEQSVSGLEGIKSAHLNFGAGILVVRGLFHPREIMRHAKRAGYRATVVDKVGKHPYGPLVRDAGPVWFLALAALFFVSGVVVAEVGLSWPDFLLEHLPSTVTLEKTLFALSVFYGGYHTIRRALHGLRHRRLDASFLAVIIAIGALVIGKWLEAAAAISLFALRELLLARSLEGARRYVRAAWASLPDDARRLSHEGQKPEAVSPDEQLAFEEAVVEVGRESDGAGPDGATSDGHLATGHDEAVVEQEDAAFGTQDEAISDAQEGTPSDGELSLTSEDQGDPTAAERDGETPISRLAAGDVCVVGPGQRVPVDGVVVQGGAIVHEPPLTGAEVPVGKREGDFIDAGSGVDEGEIHIRVERPAAESALVRALRLVEGAQGTPLLTLRWVSRAAAVLSSIAVAAALVTALVPPLVFGRSVTPWLEAALSLLVLSFPCALAASAPAVMTSAITSTARLGVLVKSGDALERLARVNTIAFEKSGAFTKARLRVTEVHTLKGWNEREVLALCAGLAWGVDDPVAEALVQAAIEADAGMVTAESSEVSESGSVEGVVGGERYAVGSIDAMERRGVALTQVLALIASLEKEGKIVALATHGQAPIAVAALSETVIEESHRALRRLKRMPGIDTLVMLTDEDERCAVPAALELQVDEYRAGLRPEDKVKEIKQYQRQGKRVAMVGKYQDDRSALAVADVGVALGPLERVDALEKADVLIVGNDFGKLPQARVMARRTLAIGWQNVVATLVIKAIALALLFFGQLTLWQAAVADFLTALVVALGITRMFRKIRLPYVREPVRRRS